MESITQERVESYVELFGQVNQRVQNDELAGRILSELARDRRQDNIAKEKQNGNGNGGNHDNRPATERQIKAMDKRAIAYWPDITLREASTLIKSAKLNEENGQ